MYVEMHGDKVQELRSARGMSRRDLAAAAGISLSTAWRAERAEPVRVSTAKAVAAALEVDPPQRLGRSVSQA